MQLKSPKLQKLFYLTVFQGNDATIKVQCSLISKEEIMIFSNHINILSSSDDYANYFNSKTEKNVCFSIPELRQNTNKITN